MGDYLPPSLQESILAILIFEEKAGSIIAAQVSPKYFDESYREIAERVLDYRRKYSRGPGLVHLDDLFDKRLGDNNRPTKTRRILTQLAALSTELNVDYIVSQTQTFIREQQIKAALVAANARWEQGGEKVAPDIEGILHNALRFRTQTLDAGTFFNDLHKSLRFLDRSADDGVPFGIDELDRAKLALRSKEMTLYIAPKGTGKTWAAVHVGKQAFKARKRIVHITCEVSEEIVLQRYCQSFFAAATRSGSFVRTTLDFDDDNDDGFKKLLGFRTNKVFPNWDFTSPEARKELRSRMTAWGIRLHRLVIKEFPSGTLTLPHLEAYLDFLMQEHKFQPDVLIVDYPDLMAQDSKNYRISLGRTFVDLRGILVDRNMAGFCPTQGNRSSLRAEKVRSSMVAEDISKINTADIVMTYSRTEAEEERHLGRLHVAHARTTGDGMTVILTQSYATGQYVIASAPLQSIYWEILKTEPQE